MAAVASSVRVELGWPDERLSPNARVHFMQVSSARKKAKNEAGWATRIALGRSDFYHQAPIPVHIIAHPPLAWRTADDDNLISRLKSHFDAIARALGVNDRDFKQTGVTWAERKDRPVAIIVIGEAS
jgi:crossover junction endodeoxyribonuclease RusA